MQLNLESVIQSKVSQKEKNKYILMKICGTQKNGTDETISRAGIEMQLQRMDIWTWGQGEGENGINWEIGIDIYILSCIKQRRRQWHLTPVLLPGKSHGWRSLVGCSPWGRQELDTTEQLHFHFSLCCIGEGNGNPLQCSCLENPRDRGAWWAAVYGVAQSRTRLM